MAEFHLVRDMAAAELTYLPAIWTVGAVALLLYAVAPPGVTANWAILGEPTGLPECVMSLSSFTHLPALPADPFRLAGVLVITVGVGIVSAAAMRLVRVRDILSA
ncbi:MAG: hypothetical protein OEW29_13265 [Acidimicrobiia bacterium]|nr:hypothetical protein [Acidimicrobiia bacterium]